MSTLKADTVTTKSDNTDLTITGGGTGVPNLEAGFKVGGSAGVPTASIQDDAVTLAKLAAGTDGELITWDASGDPAAVAVGTATHVLTSNGAGAAPTFQAAAAGGSWTVIGTAVASDSASIEVSGIGTTYDYYAVGGAELIPGTDVVQGRFRVGTSGGINTSNYSGGVMKWRSNADAFYGTGMGPGRAQLDVPSGDQWGNDTSENGGFMLFWTSRNDALFTIMHGTYYIVTNGAYALGGLMLMKLDVVGAIDRVNWSYASGNVASGRLTVWGINHA